MSVLPPSRFIQVTPNPPVPPAVFINTANCWARNIKVLNCDLGIATSTSGGCQLGRIWATVQSWGLDPGCPGQGGGRRVSCRGGRLARQ